MTETATWIPDEDDAPIGTIPHVPAPPGGYVTLRCDGCGAENPDVEGVACGYDWTTTYESECRACGERLVFVYQWDPT